MNPKETKECRLYEQDNQRYLQLITNLKIEINKFLFSNARGSLTIREVDVISGDLLEAIKPSFAEWKKDKYFQ